MHGWNMTPWKFQVYSMNGSDFRGKTVGPVCFERAGTLRNMSMNITDLGLCIYP